MLKLSLISINKKKILKTPLYDQTTLKNLDVQRKFVYDVLKKFDKLNENFETSCRYTAVDTNNNLMV